MNIRFWGTRGSLPTPGTGTTCFGGNTSCVEIRTDSGVRFVLDCGTGVRPLGLHLMETASKPIQAHVLIGHTHWDHIQGFPFFAPAFVPGNRFWVYGPRGSQGSLQETLEGQMEYQYFPVELAQLPATMEFHELSEGTHDIGGVRVRTQYLHHPATALGYRIEADGAAVLYLTDHEPYSETLWRSDAVEGRIDSVLHDGDRLHARFMAGADVVIHDAQYTPEEYRSKRTWGHSTYEYVVELAAAAGVRRLALTHHDPMHDDVFVADIEERARAVAAARGSALEVFCAREGMDLTSRGTLVSQGLASEADVTRRAEVPSGVQILVVDDDEVLRGLAVRVLAKLGHSVTEAADGFGALRAIERGAPDLVVLDLEMPGMSGIEVLRALRAKTATATLPVLILTAQADERATRAGFDAGATDYITKPFSIPQLRARVHACLARAAQRKA